MSPSNQRPLAESEIETGVADRRTRKLEEVHSRAMLRFDAISGPQAEMRAQSLEARRFVTVPGAMWEGDWGAQWENAPKPEVDKITKALEKIETDYRENRLTVDYIPSGGASSDTADTLDGLHRADSYHFKAQQARDNAFQEAIRGGFGAYRLTTDYTDVTDPEDESQRVNPGLVIVDADQCVYFDDASTHYDKSDAKWAFVVAAQPRADAEDAWGTGIAPWPVVGFQYQYDWYAPDVVRTAEYYEVEYKRDKLLLFRQKSTPEGFDLGADEIRVFESEIEPEYVSELRSKGYTLTERSMRRKRVHKYIVCGSCVLRDCGYIAGSEIPIVPVYFRRDFVDGMERWRGYVGKMMDRQRIYNGRIAKMVESDSLSPRRVPVFLDGQLDERMSQEWAEANFNRVAYLRVKPVYDQNGQMVATGPIAYNEPPQLDQNTAALLQIAGADLTDNDDSADVVKANVSAEAMDIAATRVDSRSGIPLDNMRQSVAREGEIYLSMARDVYYEPGRKVETLTLDGVDGTATLSEGHVDGAGVYQIRNDLQRGRYKVIADVQEATKTRRQKTVKESLAMAQISATVAPELSKAALLTAVMNQDGEGLQEMQEWARKQAVQLGLTEPSDEEKAAAEQAAQAAQPDAAQLALQAQAEKYNADAQRALAQVKEIEANIAVKASQVFENMRQGMLLEAQTSQLGGPTQAPPVPTGLSAGSPQGTPPAVAPAEPATDTEPLAPPPVQ